MKAEIKVDYLKGKIITKIDKIGDKEFRFFLDDGTILKMYHSQDCCECVHIEDIVGCLDDLIGTPIIKAHETTNSVDNECITWTYYNLATVKGYVDIRWLGKSNGYYSESVDLELYMEE